MQNKSPKYYDAVVIDDAGQNNSGEFTVFSGTEEQIQEVAPAEDSLTESQTELFMADQAEAYQSADGMVMAVEQPAVVGAVAQNQQQYPPQQMSSSHMQPTHQEESQPSQSESAYQPQPDQSLRAFEVSQIVMRPSASLLIFRLLGVGVVLLLILFFLALTVDMIRFIFGEQVLVLLNNRAFTFTLGIIIYMVVGFVVYEQWSHTVYTLTTDKLIMDRGWIFRNRQTRDMVQFGGVQVSQGVVGKMFNFGDLRLEYHGAIGKVAGETLQNIPDPFVHEQMLSKMFSNIG